MCDFMKFIYILISILFIAACGSTQADKNESSQVDSADTNRHDSIYGDSDETYFNEIDTFYIVVADTGNDYYELRDQMLSISNTANLIIDTMGRYYNEQKKLIQLPDNDEDEVYRGDYFPRRFPSESLSLEYLTLYNSISGDNTIALVTGIFETKHSADSARQSILNIQPKTFVLESRIYTGCMH
jgi:hypothetical protein